MPDSPQSVAPQNVELAEKSVRILWDDGHQGVYPHRFLRLACPCASCIDEMTGEPRLDPATVPDEVRVDDYMAVGSYALQFLFTDAHYTGIYTFERLREICTCRQCWESRA